MFKVHLFLERQNASDEHTKSYIELILVDHDTVVLKTNKPKHNCPNDFL